MSGDFYLDNNRHFIVQKTDNDVSIFIANKDGLPTILLSPISYESFKSKDYVRYEFDTSFINIIDNINVNCPLLYIYPQEQLLITTDFKILYVVKNNGYSVYPVNVKYDTNIYNNEKYKNIIERLELGSDVNIDGYTINKNSFYMCLNDPSVLNKISDDKVKNIYYNLIDFYNKNNKTDLQGGTGSENAKVLVKHSGFGNRIFVLCINKYLF